MSYQKFMIDNLSLRVNDYGPIACTPLPCQEKVPALFSRDEHVISRQATGPFGQLHFHELESHGFNIRQNQFMPAEDVKLSLGLDTSSLGFHFNLKNQFDLSIKGFPEGVIRRNQYNMIYVPKVDWEYQFKKGEEHVSFSIHFSEECLERCNEAFPLLSNFLESVRKRNPAIINHFHLPATSEILDMIHGILHSNYTGVLKAMYLESKLPGLLLLSLQGIPAYGSFRAHVNLRTSEVDKLHEVREYLVQNLDLAYTLPGIAQDIGLNLFKLKVGFKQIFGISIHAFLMEERMRKAKALLYEQDKSINEIASETGYRNLSNFTVAFKKKFGYPPSEIKKRICS